jgi:hypothetical protein
LFRFLDEISLIKLPDYFSTVNVMPA